MKGGSVGGFTKRDAFKYLLNTGSVSHFVPEGSPIIILQQYMCLVLFLALKDAFYVYGPYLDCRPVNSYASSKNMHCTSVAHFQAQQSNCCQHLKLVFSLSAQLAPLRRRENKAATYSKCCDPFVTVHPALSQSYAAQRSVP